MLELQDPDGAKWVPYDIKIFAADVRVVIVRSDGVEGGKCVGSSECRHR